MVNIYTIEAFQDNYIWLFSHDASNSAAVVDPGDADPVIQALEEHNLTLDYILITHHHHDHTGGVNRLIRKYPNLVVYGPKSNHFQDVNQVMKEGDNVELNGLHFEVLNVAGHTLDHIAYFARPTGEPPLLFCGDTLFAGGCGRVFEGTPQQMYGSLQKLTELPPETRVFCAHEYTLANLTFAKAVEPDNRALLERYDDAHQLRQSGKPTVPSAIGIELETNPFLRCQSQAVKDSAERFAGHHLDDEVNVFKTIRAWKDNF